MNRFEHVNGVVTLGFQSLAGLPVQAHVAMRHGGVSPAPWQSLNFSVARGDAPARVAENRRRLAAALALDAEQIVRCQQVHGAEVRCVGDQDAGALVPACDGLVTRATGLPLALVFADCVPVVLYDTRQHVLGACHAGWRGTVAGTAAATVAAMSAAFGTQAEDVRAGIGPSIGPVSYEVGEEVMQAAYAGLPFAERCLSFPDGNGSKPYFDLWAANRLHLIAAGVPARQIETAEIDTAQQTQDFFSHRAEKGQCGLFCMIAWLT